jgi:hypothetical protein
MGNDRMMQAFTKVSRGMTMLPSGQATKPSSYMVFWNTKTLLNKASTLRASVFNGSFKETEGHSTSPVGPKDWIEHT